MFFSSSSGGHFASSLLYIKKPSASNPTKSKGVTVPPATAPAMLALGSGIAVVVTVVVCVLVAVLTWVLVAVVVGEVVAVVVGEVESGSMLISTVSAPRTHLDSTPPPIPFALIRKFQYCCKSYSNAVVV